MDPKNSLLPEQIKKKLSSRWIAREINFYHELDSTNLTALELAQQGVPEGTVVLADQQLHGRGRGDRSWHSPPGVGVYCSIILRPRLSPARAQVLTLMTAVAVAKAIHMKVGLSPVIKWPNDILMDEKKVAGILLQSRAGSAMMEHAVIGIGINVNHTPADLTDEIRSSATSLRIELGRPVERGALIGQVFVELERVYEKVQQGDTTTVLKQWRSFSTTLGRHVKVLHREEVIEGIAVDVTPEGALIVRLQDGQLRPLHAGEVEHLKMFGSRKVRTGETDTYS